LPLRKEAATQDSTGFGPTEARTYRTLLTAPATSIDDLAHRLGVSVSDADRALRSLEAKGLVGRLPGIGSRFRATPPADAFRPLVKRRQAELRHMRADIEALTDVYRGGSPQGEPVELLPGRPDGHVAQLLSTAATEVCALVVLPAAPALSPTGARVPTGVAIRVVYPQWFLDDDAGRERIEAAGRSGARVRIAERPPFPLLTVDRSVALIRVRTDEQDAALLVHAGGLNDALLAIFERTWAVAERLSTETDEEAPAAPGPEDLRLLGLLLDGLTDEAIAGKLDVGTRTVQRRVHDLIELAGVRTRLQLVWYATRNGWV